MRVAMISFLHTLLVIHILNMIVIIPSYIICQNSILSTIKKIPQPNVFLHLLFLPLLIKPLLDFKWTLQRDFRDHSRQLMQRR